MKIDSSNDAALAAVSATAAKADRGPAPGAAAVSMGAVSGVPVSVSASARALGNTSAEASFDETKVAAMRAAIANGTFSVNAGAVADKLLSTTQEFLSRSGN